VLALLLVPAVAAAAPPPPEGVVRIAGPEPVGTAIALSEASFDDGEALGAVLIAADNFPDALAGAPLAASVGGPLLPTPVDDLDDAVADELVRVLPDGATVTLLGLMFDRGQVPDQVRALGFETRVVGGFSRIETAVEAARATAKTATVFLVRADTYTDAAIAAPAAIATGGTVVLSTVDEVPEPTREYLAEVPDATVYVLGDVAAPEGAERIAGDDPAALSVAVASRFFPDPQQVAVTGAFIAFREALVGSRFVGGLDGPLLLSDPDRLSDVVADYLIEKSDGIAGATLVGDEDVLSEDVRRDVEAALRGEEPPPREDPTEDPTEEPTDQPIPTTRLAGGDRLATAVAISRDAFPDLTAGAVVLARADTFPDALAGTPLAVQLDGPLLLTASDRLSDQTADELQRVLAPDSQVILLGGPDALSPAVADGVQALGYQVVRYQGANRFETAVRIAEALPSMDALLYASGNNFPDALGAGPAAVVQGGPILLTAGDTLPPETAEFADRNPAAPSFAIGGPAAQAVPDAEPIVGADRYDTNIRLARRFFPAPPLVGVATGVAFPDALAGGARTAQSGGPVLLSAPADLPDAVAAYLREVSDGLDQALLFGGEQALSPAVETELDEVLRQG